MNKELKDLKFSEKKIIFKKIKSILDFELFSLFNIDLFVNKGIIDKKNLLKIIFISTYPFNSYLYFIKKDAINNKFTDKTIENKFFTKDKKIYLFYHVFCQNDWKEIVDEHFNLIQTSGLDKFIDKFYINLSGKQEDLDYLKSKLIFNCINFEKIPNEYEFPTLEKMIRLSKIDDFVGIYLHTKSSSVPINHKSKIGNTFWRHFMNYQIINKWRVCYEKILNYDLVGTLFHYVNLPSIDFYWKNRSEWFQPNIDNFVSGREILKGPKYQTSHYSGNFFWFNSRYFKTLRISPKEKLNRFNAEFLAFQNNPKHFNIYADLDMWKSRMKEVVKLFIQKDLQKSFSQEYSSYTKQGIKIKLIKTVD